MQSFIPTHFIPVISMLVRDRKSAFENDMIYVKGFCHDVHEMAPSREKGIFSAHTASARGGCRKDRYHLSIPLKRPRDTSLVCGRAIDFIPLFPQRPFVPARASRYARTDVRIPGTSISRI